jgi:hypothetical protein
MKSYRVIGSSFMGMAFLAGVVGLYYGTTAHIFLWAMFPPVKVAQYVAHGVLRLGTEQSILFSLATGVPLTVWYWWLLLRGLQPTVRR